MTDEELTRQSSILPLRWKSRDARLPWNGDFYSSENGELALRLGPDGWTAYLHVSSLMLQATAHTREDAMEAVDRKSAALCPRISPHFGKLMQQLENERSRAARWEREAAGWRDEAEAFFRQLKEYRPHDYARHREAVAAVKDERANRGVPWG